MYEILVFMSFVAFEWLFSQTLWLFKSKGFPLQAHGSAGRSVSLLGCACGVSPVPLVPQEAARLPLQSPYVKGEEDEIAFKSNNLLEKELFE
ncbi:MAG: hypothetical protein ACQEUT_03065 [Bacillota bacterium]